MNFEPILAFFIIRFLRKTLRTFSPDERWNKIFTIAMYVIPVLFIIEIFLSGSHLTGLFWDILLLSIIGFVFLNSKLQPARTAMFAVLPLVIFTFLGNVTETFANSLYRWLEDYFDYSNLVTITWMVALLVRSGKQQKALLNERKKREEEEERRLFMENQRIQLEALVVERTSELQQQKEELQHTLEELKSTQAQLIQSEKMASLGQLTAGIAHEIQNPLNFVNNFSEISIELLNELKSGPLKTLNENDKKDADVILSDITQNLDKITHHGKRADSIVKGMLLHSRKNTGQKELTDINALADEYLRLSYHGLRAKDKDFNVTMKTDFDEKVGKINIIAQDVGRVLLNLINNALYAVNEKKKTPTSLKGSKEYEPVITVSTKAVNLPSGDLGVEIRVKDNGNGIPQNITEKIFHPFFTTKPTGQGTGLGLSLSYDIIKSHGGEIKVESVEGEGSEFIIHLPIT